MTRSLIVGTRDRLAETIDALHELKLLHIVDHQPAGSEFPIGSPLPQAAAYSEALIKLRSVSNILQVRATETAREPVELTALREKIAALELNINEEAAAKKEVDTLLADLARRIDELRPFAALGLPLGSYRGYQTIAVIVGRAPRGVGDLATKFPRSEVFESEGIAVAFVPRADTEAVGQFLAALGFTPLEVPAGEGDPAELLARAEADQEKWILRKAEVEERLETLRERYAGFVVAAQDALEVEVEKAEAPLRFAVSDHSFVIDGWVPSSRVSVLDARLSSMGIHGEFSETHAGHNPEEPPVLLRNPKPAKPFEMLIHLYSTPSYKELDPTLFMLVAFPFFFGFMIGDAGYGAVFLAIGAIGLLKLPKESDFRRLLLIIAVGGFWALGFGLFVFGEAFGMAFHLPPGAPAEELSWANFGIRYPIEEPLIHKSLNIGDMFYLSILFGALHLGTSYVMGFVNEIGHSKKHALAKIGWLMCLFGIFTILTRILSWTRVGGWVWNVALAWFPRMIEPFGLSATLGMGIPLVSILLIFGAFLGLVESPVAPLEIGSLLANLLSYLRLAAIGIGKATIAATFNSLIFRSLILDHDIVFAAVGAVLLVFAQLLVFLLGGVSAGIQGVRLNYVESFTKFYKGNGTPFRPFGIRKPQEV